MSFIQRVRMALRGSSEAKSLFGDESLLSGVLRGGEPPSRGTKELIRAYKFMPWLRAVNTKVSTSVAGVTWELYIQNGSNGKAIRNNKLQYADEIFRRSRMAEMRKDGELREIETHPLLSLLDNANPMMTGRTARQVTQTYLDLKGEAFWILERNNQGMPIEFWPVPPHWIVETPSAKRPFYRVNFKNWQGQIPAEEMIWLKDPDPENPYGRGTGIGESLTDELETDEYAAKYLKSWFYNRAVPELLIGVEGADEGALNRAKHKWENEHRGFWKAFRSYWHSGKMDVQQLGYSFQQQQLMELRRQERDTIMNVYGLSPEVMGVVENSNRATAQAADYIFSRWVLAPRLEFLRSEMQEYLVPQFDERLILEYVSPIPADHEFSLQVATAAPWSLTRNEWREMQGLPEDEVGGDFYFMPLNLMAEPQGASPGPKAHKPKKKMLDRDDINLVIRALRPERLISTLVPVVGNLVEEWGGETLSRLGVDISFNMLNPLVALHMRTLRENKIKGLTNKATERYLRETLIEGIQHGEGIPDLADRVSKTFSDAKGYRAERIARTETLNSSNFAETSAQAQSGVVDLREWLATKDGLARDDHLDLDGQQRAIDKPFTLPSGKTAMYPGDFGVAEQDINCRCTTIAIIGDPKSEEWRVAVWREFDRKLIPWERKILAAAKRGFQAQQNDVMEVLNEFRD